MEEENQGEDRGEKLHVPEWSILSELSKVSDNGQRAVTATLLLKYRAGLRQFGN